jgi:hypothetical protein
MLFFPMGRTEGRLHKKCRQQKWPIASHDCERERKKGTKKEYVYY